MKSLLDFLPKEPCNTYPLVLSPVNLTNKEDVEYVVPWSEIAKAITTDDSRSRNEKGINLQSCLEY
jgi:hypothetical protein